MVRPRQLVALAAGAVVVSIGVAFLFVHSPVDEQFNGTTITASCGSVWDDWQGNVPNAAFTDSGAYLIARCEEDRRRNARISKAGIAAGLVIAAVGFFALRQPESAQDISSETPTIAR